MAQQGIWRHHDHKISWKNKLNIYGGGWTVKKWRCKNIESTLVQFETTINVAPQIFNAMVADLQDLPVQPANKRFSSMLRNVILGNATIGNHTIEYLSGNAAMGAFYCYNSAGFKNGSNINSVKHIENKLQIDLDSIGVNFAPSRPNTINIHVKFNLRGGWDVEFLPGKPHLRCKYPLGVITTI